MDAYQDLFYKFSADEWSSFAHKKENLVLSAEEIKACLAFNDKLPLDEIDRIYQPLSRLLHLHFTSAKERSKVLRQFLGSQVKQSPYVISISGSVSVGKTTTARLLKELLSRWPCKPKVDLITTDGYLYNNKTLEQRKITTKKGFPISYDVKHLMSFMSRVKSGEGNLKVPVYSHLYYDVMPDEFIIVDRPDILIVEGVNVLQNGADYPEIRNKIFMSDFIDFSIYVDAEEENLIHWYIERFKRLRGETFNNPNCYFHRFASLSEEDAVFLAKNTWEAINHVNLVENIEPCRSRASLILKKSFNHRIEEVYMRR